MENIEDAPEELTEEESLAAARKARKETIGAVILVIVIVLGAIGLYQLGTSAGKLKEEDAYAYCQTQVKQYLKDPGSAEFPAGSYSTSRVDDSTFQVEGTGRARNSFNGMDSFTYRCTVSQHSDGEIYASAHVE